MRTRVEMGDHLSIASVDSALSGLPDPATDQPILTGTSVAVARRAQVSTLAVRIGFVLLSLASGLGVLLYGAAWLAMGRGRRFVPEAQLPMPAQHDPRRNLGFGLLLVAALLVVASAGWTPRALWPAVIVALGVGVAWRQGSGTSRGHASTQDADDEGGVLRRDLLRQGAGVLLVLVGTGVLLFSNFTITVLFEGIIAGLILTAGIALVLGPWMLRAARTAIEERRERVRSEERAAMAEHLHDSVLQTLTLIQKRTAATDDPEARQISVLARRQERELRHWLYGASRQPQEGTLRSTIESVVADVEDLHGVAVEMVIVGDAAMTPDLEAVVAAVREAMVNAAKFSGRGTMSLFVEVSADQVSAFVRDRGVGFDLEQISEDRHGVRDSIIGRIERCGGNAVVHSSQGSGTEVKVTVALQSASTGDEPEESGVPSQSGRPHG